MKFQRFVPAILAGVLLLVGSCQKLEEEGPTGGGKIATQITGTVIRSDDGTAVPLAIIRDVSNATVRDTTDDNGIFALVYDLDPNQTYTSSIFAARDLFGNDTVAISLKAGVDTSITLTLTADSTSPVTSVRSGRPASIVLIGTDVATISIRGSGVNESALLTYEVRDSLGNPITGEASPDTVRFNIIGGPDGGEYVFPAISKINATTGRVTTRLNSGTRPGVIQVQAATRNDSVVSSPARITIASGPPDGNNVAISREKANIPGLVYDNERSRITVILGDRFQNPVPEGTAVYFTTNMGLVQATGKTDVDGIASAELISANPRPAGLGGIATVIARTIGDTSVSAADSLIQRTINVTFSGASQIQMQTTPILLADSGSYTLNYQVQDQFGNPLSEGTTIGVTLAGPAGGELTLSGDVDVTTTDTDDTTATNYTVRVQDNTRGGLSGVFTVKVEVKSRNGDLARSVSGFLQSTGGGSGLSGGQSIPRSIVLNNITNRKLSVKGTGANESSRLTFLVRDSLGNPVGNPLDPTQKALVSFSINPSGGLGGGEFVFPVTDSTDDNGLVSVTFNAGATAGVLQVVASTVVPGIGQPITASPVQLTIEGGLPDSNKFVASISRENMPGLVKTGPLGSVQIQAGDEFGNPAQSGTAVYFSTSLGLIKASEVTGDDGTASVSLQGGVTGTTNGAGTVTVQTIGKQGEAIRRQLPFLFTGLPLITGLPANGFAIVDSGTYTFSFTVADANGNPLVGGTSIAVTVDGPGSQDLELSGDVAVTLPDTRNTSYTNFSVTVVDKLAGGASGAIAFKINVSGENGTASATHTGTVLSSGQAGGAGGIRSISTLELESTSPQSISVQGTGAKSSATYTFLAKDSTGRSLDASNKAYVTFTLFPSGGLGGGETISLAGDSTDRNGRASVTFQAGTAAGILNLLAKGISSGSTDTVTAPNVKISVNGGLPDSNNVIVSLTRVNMPGLIQSGPVGQVNIQAGDNNNNPVQAGTAFYFTTSLGIMQASATTDETGRALSQLSGGVNGSSNGNGSVTVRTIGQGGLSIQKTIDFLFTGTTAITGAPSSGFLIADSGSYSFTFKVADGNGNPLVSGSQITVSVEGPGSGDIELSGDASRTIPDTRDTSFTNFSVKAQDKSAGGVSGPLTIKITVTSENGPATYSFSGTQLKEGELVGPGSIRSVASLELESASGTAISIRGTGSKETSSLVFVAKDSLGFPVDESGRAFVRFSLAPAGGLGGGEFLSKVADSTDDNGRVRVTFSAGTKAGVLQIKAKTTAPGRPDTIYSSPVRLTIAGGLPDSNQVVATLSKSNIPGLLYTGPLATVSVQAGDQYNNPVQPGTAFYFTTSLGLIQASALTDANGQGSVQLSGGLNGGVNGSGEVKVQTVGSDGESIVKFLPFLFTGQAQITGIPANGFVISDGGEYEFPFKVSDVNGNPLGQGTLIKVTFTGPQNNADYEFSGDKEITLPDTRDTNYTNFKVKVKDLILGGSSGPITFRVNVIGPNGEANAFHSGTHLTSGQSAGSLASTRYVASLELENTVPPSISVRGGGSTESVTFTFIAKDSLGKPIDEAARAYVKFSIAGAGLGGGEFLSLAADSTNEVGRVNVTFTSGTKAGVLQVLAKTGAPGRADSIVATPVRLTIHGGLPDSNNVFLSLSATNLAGKTTLGSVGGITAHLGDIYNNPVRPGTAVYFTTSLGIITASSLTDDFGFATANLYGTGPGGATSSGTVTMQTVGIDGVSITKTASFVFSGSPVISGLPSNGFSIPDSGSYSFTFKVADANGSPLVAGSQVQVSVSGSGSESLELTGDASRVFPDTPDTSYTNFSVTATDLALGGLSGPVTFKISVSSSGGSVEANHTGSQLSSGQTAISAAIRRVASLELESSTATSVSIRGTGSKETSTLTFVAKDSLGSAIGATGRAYVVFGLSPAGGLGGGEFLSTMGDSTDDNGKIAVTFNAGTKAGVLQVFAKTAREGAPTDTILSSPVRLTVSGGFPDSNNIIVTMDRVNFAGLVKSGPIATIRVQVGDKYKNPVQPGTALYFTTDLGLIQATATTDAEGAATVSLSGGGSSSTGAGLITVQTVGENGVSITKTKSFLFTGSTTILEAPVSGFTIPDSGSYGFSIRVGDANGNPLVQGSSINVTVSGPGSAELILSGEIQNTMPDIQDTSFTRFDIVATDPTRGGTSGAVDFVITVISENGTKSYLWSGTQLASGQSSSAGNISGYPASILLSETSIDPTRVLSVSGTGLNESAVMRFVVKDSLGNPITLTRQSWVKFSIHGNPGGGEYIFPDSAQTDASGEVYATINSGTKAGVMQIRATTTVGATTISSNPIVFTIAGGLPDSNRVSVWTDAQNYPGLVQAGNLLGNVFVQMGDQYGNPVQEGTAVYFTSTGGLVSASAFTNDEGKVTANLFGGGKAPVLGQDTITVSTVGPDNILIAKQVAVTFSGSPIVTPTSISNDSVTIFDSGYFDLDFTLADVNGNPLAAGNNVSMTVTGTAASGISLSGDAGFTTIDTRSTSFTSFRVRLIDNVPEGGVSGSFTLRINVSGPNGTTTKLIYGNLGAPAAITPPSPTVKQPAQIAFVGISATDIFVSGVGALENSVITYEVRDSLGFPIEASPRAYASFTLSFYPNSYVPSGSSPRLLPSADSTDNAGRLRVSMNSGTTAGVIQVTATIDLGGGAPLIKSSPVRVTVHAGFPDQRHFTMSAPRYNFPGLDRNFVELLVTVQVADKYSNPVQSGTAVYFHSAHGTMETGGGGTDVRGFVARTLNSANPYPLGADTLQSGIGEGYSYVYSQSLGDSADTVEDSILVLWTGRPIITKTAGPSDTVIGNGGTAGPYSFTVVDRLGHPMSEGTTISVAAGSFSVSGHSNITIFDTFSTGTGITTFSVLVTDGDPANGVAPPLKAFVTVNVNHPVYGNFPLVLGSLTGP